ncbi:MAG UNVERIFIED_CONTAM: hypothetical protein LVR18_32870 [Planctomycetaceae bacterium]
MAARAGNFGERVDHPENSAEQSELRSGFDAGTDPGVETIKVTEDIAFEAFTDDLSDFLHGFFAGLQGEHGELREGHIPDGWIITNFDRAVEVTAFETISELIEEGLFGCVTWELFLFDAAHEQDTGPHTTGGTDRDAAPDRVFDHLHEGGGTSSSRGSFLCEQGDGIQKAEYARHG